MQSEPTTAVHDISDSDLRLLLHPTEESRLRLAMISLTIIAGYVIEVLVSAAQRGLRFGSGVVLVPGGDFLIAVLTVFLSIVFARWLAARVLEARLRGSAIEVDDENFPELKAVVMDVCRMLDYRKPISVFVIKDGEINLILRRLFGRQSLWINSGVVEAMGDPSTRAELVFLVGRFVGALKARHLRFRELMAVINNFERLAMINLFILPYLRSTVFSGDQIGVAVCGDMAASLRAMSRLLVGKDLADRLSIRATTAQAIRQQRTFFRFISIVSSAYPHTTDRFLNLVRFSQTKQASHAGVRGLSDPALVAAAALVPELRAFPPRAPQRSDEADPGRAEPIEPPSHVAPEEETLAGLPAPASQRDFWAFVALVAIGFMGLVAVIVVITKLVH
jgi:hypothetical protein